MTLDETIWSVRRQTLAAWAMLIVDDGSTDRTAEIAERHARDDGRIRVIRQPNAGVSAARNRAMREATTRWVALLDHDDLYLPDKLARQLAALEARPDLAALGTYGHRMGPAGQRLGYFEVGPRDEAHFHRLRERGEVIYLLASSVVFDRELALRVGGFPTLPPVEDVALWSRLAEHAPVLVLPERLVVYRVLAGSATGKSLRRQRLATQLLVSNIARRRTGRPELTLAEFEAQWEARPAAERRAFDRETASLSAYRVAGQLLADRRPSGLLWLARSIALNPAGRLERLVTQLDLRRRVLTVLGRRPRGPSDH